MARVLVTLVGGFLSCPWLQGRLHIRGVEKTTIEQFLDEAVEVLGCSRVQLRRASCGRPMARFGGLESGDRRLRSIHTALCLLRSYNMQETFTCLRCLE